MKMIIDTDPGVDDAMAIFYAALAPDIELLGLTTIFGNVSADVATRNALYLSEMAELDIPVAKGASKPLKREPTEPTSIVHGAEGFGDLPAVEPKGYAIKENAAEYLCRMARIHKNELVICAIGPVTNIADAIKLDASFASNVKKIVFMGGAAFTPGNITEFAEANSFHDPHALNIVLNSGAHTLMVGLDVTMKVLCNAEFFSNLATASPKYGQFLKDISEYYLDFYAKIVNSDGCGLHDPAAVIACTHPELFDIKQLSIQVIEEGNKMGQTLCNDAHTPTNTAVCIGGDMEAVKEKFRKMFA